METIATNLSVIAKKENGTVKFLSGHPMRNFYWGELASSTLFVTEGGYRGKMPEGAAIMNLPRAILTVTADE